MQRVITILTILILNTIPNNEGYRILVVVPMPSKSHGILGHGVARHLLEAGHEVVHVTAYPVKQPKANYSEINVSPLEERISKLKEEMEVFKLKNMVGQENAANSLFVLLMAQSFHEQLFELENFKRLINDPNEKFDAVILEWFYFDGLAGIASVLQCPLIWFVTTDVHWNAMQVIDEIPNPAYNVDIYSSYKPPLTFWQRIKELREIIYRKLAMSAILLFKEKPTYNTVLSKVAANRGIDLPSYEDAVYNGSLLLINSHPSYGSAFKLPQNSKYIGGFHVETKDKPLTKDFQDIMDSAKDGLIFFSMGSNFKSSDMSDEMKTSLLNAFGEVKQTVIWKFESKLDKVPPNVHLVKWAPQQGILAHPNLKIFITHGGQLSTTEAIHHGVPVIGIPIAADQLVNMKSVVTKGWGISVKLSHDLGSALKKAINQIISDPRYKHQANEISRMYHDRLVPSGKEMVYWVEHVVRTRGALHLRSPALMVPWYQKIFLDLLAIAIVITYLVVRVLRIVIRRCKSTKHKNSKKDQ